MKAMNSRDRSSEPNGGGNVDALRYEVWEDDNSGGRVAAFRYIDDARAFAGPISGLVYDIHQEADVTQYPLDPARVGGHDLRQESNNMDFREQLKVLEQAKRDIGMIIMHLAHGEVQTASRGIETVIESLTEVSDEIRELKA